MALSCLEGAQGRNAKRSNGEPAEEITADANEDEPIGIDMDGFLMTLTRTPEVARGLYYIVT